jgi:hypothetical protein
MKPDGLGRDDVWIVVDNMQNHSFFQAGIFPGIQIDRSFGNVFDVKYVLHRGFLGRPLGVLPLLSRLLGLSGLCLLRGERSAS